MKDLYIDESSINLKIEKQVKVRNILIDVPIKYKCTAINAVFPISTKAAKKAISYSKFHPLEVFFGRSLLCMTLFDFSSTPVGPYTELTLSIPISYKNKFYVPLLSVPLSQLLGKFGFFVLSIAQSSEFAIEHGNIINGYPHYSKLINVQFKTDDSLVKVQAYGDGKEILQFQLEKSFKEKIQKECHMTYLVKEDRIFRIKMETYGIIDKSKIHNLSLGNHELAEFIKGLGISDKSIDTRFYRDTIKIINSSQLLEAI
jgi:Uri superfamily endonuclease